MSKTILIGRKNDYSVRANRWLFSILGFFFVLGGILRVIGKYYGPFEFSFGILQMLTGVYAIVFALFVFNKNSRFAPKVTVNDKFIEIKKGILKSPNKIMWSDIRRISYDSFEITFDMGVTTEVFRYETASDISIEIKKAIREVADDMGIEVVGG